MKHLLLTTIAAVVLVGCGESRPPEPPTAKAPDIPLWKAAIKGDIEAVKKHLAAGADVNAKDDQFGGTPLHHVTVKGHKEIVELLIAKGADVNVLDGGGYTPLDRAIRFNRAGIADILRNHGGKTAEELIGEPIPMSFVNIVSNNYNILPSQMNPQRGS